MYLAHFNLNARPFPITPETRAFFIGPQQKLVCDALVHVLEHRDGIVKVIGDVGAGKTTLCRWLARSLPRERFKIIYLADPTLGADHLARVLCDELHIDVERAGPEIAATLVRRRFASLAEAGRTVVLIVDEAQAVEPETLERIRLLSLPDPDGAPGARIVLFGLEELDQNLTLRELASVRDRISESFRLRRMGVSDVGDYLRDRLRNAGYEGPPVFSTNAIRAIARLSGGIPRRINIIADKAMLSAALAGKYGVRSSDIATAAREIRLQRGRARPRTAWVAGAGFAAGALVASAVALLMPRASVDPISRAVAAPTAERAATPAHAPDAPSPMSAESRTAPTATPTTATAATRAASGPGTRADVRPGARADTLPARPRDDRPGVAPEPAEHARAQPDLPRSEIEASIARALAVDTDRR